MGVFANKIVMVPVVALLVFHNLSSTSFVRSVSNRQNYFVTSQMDTTGSVNGFTSNTFRSLVDDAVAAINTDSRSGFTVIFDLLNGQKLENQTLASSTVTED